jgi:hypothetical protein
MARVLKLFLVLGVIGFIGLVGFAYFGDYTPPPTDVSLPVTLDAY